MKQCRNLLIRYNELCQRLNGIDAAKALAAEMGENRLTVRVWINRAKKAPG